MTRPNVMRPRENRAGANRDRTAQQQTVTICGRDYTFDEIREGQRRLPAIQLALFQAVATDAQLHRTCTDRTCRRRGECSGRRPPGASAIHHLADVVPPCVALDEAVIGPMRAVIMRAMKERVCGSS